MPHIPGLRSPYVQVGGLMYFGRMLDKIRLHAAGKLPADYVANLGRGFDGRCLGFLRVDYDDLKTRTLAGDFDDAQLLAWALKRGGDRFDEELEVWNGFMMKRGWRDEAAEILARRIRESGLEAAPIATMFDYLDFDEGRNPVATRAWEPRVSEAGGVPTREAIVILLMGVSGSGKTTIGLELARQLAWSFRDADDFHPPANVAKMSAGQPLADSDREPWLAAIRAHITGCLNRGEPAVITGSALKEKYRAAAIPDRARVKVVHLTGDFDLILERMQARKGHFMKPAMLESQFATLEPPADALIVDVAKTPGEIVSDIRRKLEL